MEKKFTLVMTLLLSCWLSVFAATPTVPSSNLEYTTIEGDRLTFRFQKGNGAMRIMVMKAGSAVTTLPVNGTDYIANASFGTANTAFNGSDGYVVYRNSSVSNLVSVPVTNLQPGTTYFISIFEFNGTGAATEYYTVALTGSKATVSAPTSQGSFKPATNVFGNSVTLNWNLGNGVRRLILARKGNPVNATPANLVSYLGSTEMGDGAVINGDNYVVYSGSTNTSITVTGLEPNTTYHFALFEYNGSSNPMYTTPGAAFSVLTNAGPTRASGPITFPTVDGNRLTINFSRGNGKHQLIIGRRGQAVTAVPQNGQLYEADTKFGDGFEMAPGEFVLNSLENNRNFTNLDPSTIYFFRIYDFDIDANGNTYYLTSSYSQNSGSTALPPVNQVSGIIFENVTGTTANIKYTTGDSKYRLIVMKAGSPVDAVPTDLIKYNGNANFGTGYQITPGNFVMQGATNSNQANIIGLTPGVTYHVAIWGWNGIDYPIYKQDPAREVLVIPNEPSSAATDYRTSSIEGNSFFNSWTGGDGARRLVIARKGAAVTARPVDAVTYEADNAFGDGEAIETGQFVVYDGPNRGFALDNLEAGSTYHFAVFEYNVTNNLPDYRTSTFLTGQGATVAAPTGPTVSISADNIQSTSASLSVAKGNGASRMLAIKANAPITALPQDFQNYSTNSIFGNGANIGDLTYVIGKTNANGPIAVTGLAPNTTYYVAAFEYNGTSAPVFLRPGTSNHFTTTGAGIPPPTAPSTNASFVPDGNKLTFSWDKGDGEKRIVVMKQGGAVTFNPADGIDYVDNAAFGNGVDLGDGQYVVYDGTQEATTITNLQPSTTYHVAVFEYNGTGGSSRYLTLQKLAVQTSTATAPVGGSTGIGALPTANSMAISWQNGPGNGRLVVVKEGGNITGEPANLSKYPSATQFGNGAQIGAGEFVVYAGAGNSVNVTGLDPLKTYHFSVFEYNGADAPIYNKTNVLTGQATTSSALPLTWKYFTAKEKQGGVELQWGTSDEVNTAYFVIERGAGNGQLLSIDTIAASNTSGDHDYVFNDVNAPASLVNYRIKQVDRDGKFSYSRVLSLHRASSQAGVRIYPNPVEASFRITLPSGVSRAQLVIYDVSGKQVLRKAVNNGELLNVGQLAKGLYNVVVIDAGVRYIEKLMKR